MIPMAGLISQLRQLISVKRLPLPLAQRRGIAELILLGLPGIKTLSHHPLHLVVRPPRPASKGVAAKQRKQSSVSLRKPGRRPRSD